MPYDPQIEEPGGDFNQEPTPPLSKNQKIAVTSLAVFAVFIIILWFAQLKSNIYGPFNAPAGSNQLAQTGALDQASEEAALKNKDTDSDGLNDYDELNLYKTSPYLEDTDGDGYKDGEEITKGFDPNCPQGRTCVEGLLDNAPVSQATSTSGTSNDTLNSLLNQFGATNPANQTANPAAGLNSDQLNALKNIDAASLRQLLIEQGMDKATLDKISDADLLKSFQETISGQ